MQINSPDARGFGSSSIDSPGESFVQDNQHLEKGQASFDALLETDQNDLEDEIGESGGSSDEALLEMEADDDSALDLLLSGLSPGDSEEANQSTVIAAQDNAEEFVEEKQEDRLEDLEESREIAAEDEERLEEMEDAELLDIDDLQLGMDIDADVDLQQEAELGHQNAFADEVSRSGDREGRSAGLIGVELVDEGELLKQERMLEALNEESMERADDYEEAVEIAEQDNLEEDLEDQTLTIVADENGIDYEPELEAEQQLDLGNGFESSDRQGRSAGFIDAESLDDGRDGYKKVDAHNLLEAVESVEFAEKKKGDEKAVMENREEMEEIRADALESAEAEQDRVDEAEEEELTDVDDLQLMLDGAEGAVERDTEFDFVPESVSSEQGSDGAGSDGNKQRSATYVEASEYGMGGGFASGQGDKFESRTMAEKDDLDESGSASERSTKRSLEEEEDREERLEASQEESAGEHKDWVDDVYENIREGEQLFLSVEELLDERLDGDQSNADRGPAAGGQNGQDGSTGGSSTGRDVVQQGAADVSTTPGEAILTTMASSGIAGRSGFDQRWVKPEIYRMVNTIEASYYAQASDPLTISEEGGQASGVDQSAIDVNPVLDGIEIELKDDKYSNLGGTKIAFRRQDNILEVNFSNDSPLAQELLLEQGELLLKELNDRFAGGIKISLNGEPVGEIKPSLEEKKVETSVEWDAPAVRNLKPLDVWQQTGTTTGQEGLA